jgi:predicted nucleic acid-binding Zn ribbon protein
MIQMIGRGLRTVDAILHPDIDKEDCIVLDFGISTLLHGNLEQEVDLDPNKKGFKHCPACKKSVPKGEDVCPLCSVDMTQETYRQAEAEEKRVLEEFVMAEINLLESSHFVWTDLRLPNKARIAVGFNVWCCVLEYQGKWIAIGGKKTNTSIDLKTTLIHKGNKLQSLASGNDFISNHETHDSATKFANWRHERPTTKQRKWLPSQFKGVRKITKGDASAIITYSLQARTEIQNVLSGFA